MLSFFGECLKGSPASVILIKELTAYHINTLVVVFEPGLFFMCKRRRISELGVGSSVISELISS
jgi:hypothetical protein